MSQLSVFTMANKLSFRRSNNKLCPVRHGPIIQRCNIDVKAREPWLSFFPDIGTDETHEKPDIVLLKKHYKKEHAFL